MSDVSIQRLLAERIGYDGAPWLSPAGGTASDRVPLLPSEGRMPVFGSNLHAREAGETDSFIAGWAE